MSWSVPFDRLDDADLYIDRIYEGGTAGNAGDDPLQRLLPVGNQGGFRIAGSRRRGEVRLVVLYTTGADPDWPDAIDVFTGIFTYYGDNKRPGHELHDTPRGGNAILRWMFDRSSEHSAPRVDVPPILVFSKGEIGRNVVFRGLAVPGANSLASGEDLVAVWRASGGHRFQNYRATFTILDVATVERRWIDDALRGRALSSMACPEPWRRWVESGAATPLVSARLDVRSPAQQLPGDAAGREIVAAIHHYFNIELAQPTRFEYCAVEIWRMLAPATGAVDVTRPWRDGGHDAVGEYMLGPIADRLGVEFALEAKCYGPRNPVGVREMSRLISRLRFRQFGVFVTTSHFNRQAYMEVRLDKHPVVLIGSRDIVEALAGVGITTAARTRAWLAERFPP